MNPQERDVISGIFERAKQAAAAPRDPDAEKFIAEKIAEQPYAPYVMAQAIHIQEQALAQLNQEVEQLKRDMAQLQQQAQQAQQQPQGGGFLSGLFGGGAPARPAPQNQRPMGAPQGYGQQPAAGPWGGQPQQGGFGQPQGFGQPAQGGGGMGFLGTAASAAVGVAGGMLAANAIKNMFGGNNEAQAANNHGNNAQNSSHEDDSDEYEDFSDSTDTREASWDSGSDDLGGGGDFSDA